MVRRCLAATLMLLACGSSPGTTARPVVQSFTASPGLVVGDGGTVSLSWAVSGADTVSIAPGVGAVTPPSGGTVSTHVAGNTAFSLSATGPGGTASGVAQVQVCDPAPAGLAGTCNIPAAGQCVDFSSLGSSDRDALVPYCAGLGGTWGTAPCSSTGRVGTCQVPPLGPRTGVTCSGSAVILERYYPPQYDASSARTVCGTVTGATFTEG